ncbi:hypothetical protein HHI36_019022 [Cryptolaemus montrouzieri]|uniref:Uncharacterized protein n=1 Tax=Cryptolaemus montrouzieri TaxID=559131 RepID=A0ABD2P1Z9_9CUCU
MSSFSIKVWLALWGAILAAVYFAFDQERHQDSDFEKKTKSKHKYRTDDKEIQVMHSPSREMDNDYKLLLTELQMAENLMSINDHENAVLHFSNAIVMSSDPQIFIHSLRQSLPISAFDKLMNVLADTYGDEFKKECLTF